MDLITCTSMSTYVPTQSFQLATPSVGYKVKGTLRTDISTGYIGYDGTEILLLGDWNNYNNTAMVIDLIGTQLTNSGWTVTGGTYGTGVIFAREYLGTALGQLAIAIYVPGRLSVVFKGPILDIGALVVKLNGAFLGIYNFSYYIDPVLGQVITVQSLTTDPLYNSPYVLSPLGQLDDLDGHANPAVCSGNGTQYTSLSANQTTNNLGSQLVVTITESSVRSITFSFGGSYLSALSTLGVANPQYNLFMGTVGGGIVPAGVIPTGGEQPSYTMISNAYQFVIVDDVNPMDFAGNFDYGGNSILACAPFVDPTVMPNLQTSMFIVGPGMLKNQMTWNSGGLGSYAVNGDYVTFQGFGLSQNGMLTFIYPSADPVLTSNNKPIIINPSVMSAPERAIEGTVNGQIWDALTLTQAGFPVGSEQIFLGYNFHLVSQQIVPEPCSLWITYV